MTYLNSTLGKKTAYISEYDPAILFPMSRTPNREAIGIQDSLPFYGFDIWNHYEVSWLNEKGKPIVAIAQISYDCDSENIIESKSMKLYFNSFNNSRFKDTQTVQAIIENDLKARLNTSFLEIKLVELSKFPEQTLLVEFEGKCLDDLDVDCSQYHTDTSTLKTENTHVEEILHSNLLKSNCLVTNQPDWNSIQIHYKGNKINHEGLLQYIVSFRNDNEFHEQCVEKIFMDIMRFCKPAELTVYGRSTRRGGLDINAYRTTQPIKLTDIPNPRFCRQ